MTMRSRAVLAVDASTYVGTVAVIAGGSVMAESEVAMRGRDEERLMPAVVAALSSAGVRPADLAMVVCGAGPGSFTSLRIAGAIAKGLALAVGCPLHAVSTALLVSAGTLEPLSAGGYVVLVDAMRGDVYETTVDVAPSGEIAEGATAIAAHAIAVERARESGRRVIGPAAVPAIAPHARAVARLDALGLLGAPVALDGWEPQYGRLAEAQVKWEATHGRPLASR